MKRHKSMLSVGEENKMDPTLKVEPILLLVGVVTNREN